jgi:hypothetical protein
VCGRDACDGLVVRARASALWPVRLAVLGMAVLGWSQAAAQLSRVSVAGDGSQANGSSTRPAVSADGRWVAFASTATNLVASGCTTGGSQILLRDRVAGTTECVSVGPGGAPGDGPSFSPAISADGRVVAFLSSATNLVAAGCTTSVTQVFVRDRMAPATTTCVSVAPDGAPGDQGSSAVALSGDGTTIAFQAGATNLDASGCTTGMQHIFARDLAAETTTCVSVGPMGGAANNHSFSPAISGNGQLVAFESAATNLVASGCTTGVTTQVFVHDRMGLGTTICVSVTSGGAPGNGSSNQAALSADGRWVAFRSFAFDLVASGCTVLFGQVFVRDLVAQTTECVSVSPTGGPGTFESGEPALSADGRFVTFRSSASNLVASGCTTPLVQIFLRDRVAGITTCVSVAPDGTPGGGTVAGADTGNPVFGGDLLAFHAGAANLVPGDTNGAPDVFVTPVTAMLSITRASTGGGTGSGTVTSAPAGISCGAACLTTFLTGAVVTLTPAPAPGSTFQGWSGDADCADGVVVLVGPRACTATFTAQFTLTVTRAGSGTGVVASLPAGIACGAQCAAVFLDGQVVTLNPNPDLPFVFAGWSGDADCADGVVTMTADRTCVAGFALPARLTVAKTGSSGTGTVVSLPAGIVCGLTCAGDTAEFAVGTVLTLLAIPGPGSLLAGFGGDPDCADGEIVLAGPVTCTVVFSVFALAPVSVGLGGATASGASLNPSLSDDGRYVAFESAAPNLAPECGTVVAQVYVRDRLTGATRCVSRGPAGEPGLGASGHPSLSGDGRRVAFESAAANLVAGCTAAGPQVFVRDLETLVTHCVSRGSGGVAANGPSGAPALSRDGRVVVFESDATNLTREGCVTGVRQVFRHDLGSGETRCVSRTAGGAAGTLASGGPAVNRTGSVVAFHSNADSFAGSGCPGGGRHVFVWEAADGALTCVSRSPAGVPGDGASEAPALDDTGQRVAFESDARNLTAACAGAAARQVYLHDRGTGATSCVSVDATGAPGTGPSGEAALSGDGQVVAFATAAPNLSGGGGPGVAAAGVVAQVGALAQIVKKQTAVTNAVLELLSQAGGGPAPGASGKPALSQNGSVTAFQSTAPLAGDTNGQADVFVAEPQGPAGPAPADQVVITAPIAFSQFPLLGPTAVRVEWTGLPAVTQYGVEHTGANRVFAIPNDTGVDPLNGCGGLGGCFAVAGTGFTALLDPGFPAGSYQVRVIGLSAAGSPVGRFSDAVTVILGTVPSAVPADLRPALTSPTGGSTLARGTVVTLAWTALVGVSDYLVEFTGPGGAFQLPNATTLTDPGAAGRIPVAGPSLAVTISAAIPPGTYQLRVIGASGLGAPLGSFSDALTVTVP